jgi:hypothetical protein
MAKTKSYKWKVFYPGDFYAWDLEYKEPVDEAYVREDVRDRVGRKRLPAGTYVEPGSTCDWYNALSPEAKREQDEMFMSL